MNQLSNVELIAARISNSSIYNTSLEHTHLGNTYVGSDTLLHINDDAYTGEELHKLFSFLRNLYKQHHPEEYV